MRRLLFLGSLAIVVAAVVLVPLPLVELSPGPTFNVPSVVRFQGHDAQPVNGKLLATTVYVSQATFPDVVQAVFSDHHEILRERNIVSSESIRIERLAFNESARTGAAVGLRAAGLPVATAGRGARVVSVIKDSPADGKLRAGDVVIAIDGMPVRFSRELVAAAARLPEGHPVTLTVLRGGRPEEVRLTVAPIGQLGRPGIGVQVVTDSPRIDLPFPVDVDVSDVGGPSAGLMIALTAYDLASPTDIVRGRVVAGTGEIDINGNIGPIGGIAEKVAGAEHDGATIFLAPFGEGADARRAADRKLEVIEVRTFDDAVRALEAPSP